MKFARYCLSAIILIGFLLPQTSTAIDSGATSILPTIPLMITAYKTSMDGKDLDYLEVYNGGKTLARLQDWSILDIVNGGRQLNIDTSFDGWMLPGTHLVASRDGLVSGASFTITGWSDVATNPMGSLRIARDGFRNLDVNLSASNHGNDMVRTYNIDSYSTAANPFVINNRLSPHKLFDDGLYMAPSAPGIIVAEIYPYSSSCSPFDDSVLCGDYIKLYNPTPSTITLDDMVLRTDSSSASRTASNTFTLSGELASGEYKTIFTTDSGARLSLTNSGGYVWLEDLYGLEIYHDTLARYESAGSSLQGYSFALADDDTWQWTSTPQPHGDNIITAPVEAPCPEGKYRNPETNRCRSLEDTLNALTACEEGYERNPTTNRCRKIVDAGSSTLTPCKEGQERNPATNRCRSIASAVAELLPCDEGYERNPTTNRCRKVSSGEIPEAPFAVERIETQAPAWQWWVGGVILGGIAGYAIWEWRREIAKLLSRRKK